MLKNAATTFDIAAYDITTGAYATGILSAWTLAIYTDATLSTVMRTPVEIAAGKYRFTLSDAETNGLHVSIRLTPPAGANVSPIDWHAYTTPNSAEIAAAVAAALSIPTVTEIQSGLAKSTELAANQTALLAKLPTTGRAAADGAAMTLTGDYDNAKTAASASELAKLTSTLTADTANGGYLKLATADIQDIIATQTTTFLSVLTPATAPATGYETLAIQPTLSSVSGTVNDFMGAWPRVIVDGIPTAELETLATSQAVANVQTSINSLAIPTVAQVQSGLAKSTELAANQTALLAKLPTTGRAAADGAAMTLTGDYDNAKTAASASELAKLTSTLTADTVNGGYLKLATADIQDIIATQTTTFLSVLTPATAPATGYETLATAAAVEAIDTAVVTALNADEDYQLLQGNVQAMTDAWPRNASDELLTIVSETFIQNTGLNLTLTDTERNAIAAATWNDNVVAERTLTTEFPAVPTAAANATATVTELKEDATYIALAKDANVGKIIGALTPDEGNTGGFISLATKEDLVNIDAATAMMVEAWPADETTGDLKTLATPGDLSVTTQTVEVTTETVEVVTQTVDLSEVTGEIAKIISVLTPGDVTDTFKTLATAEAVEAIDTGGAEGGNCPWTEEEKDAVLTGVSEIVGTLPRDADNHPETLASKKVVEDAAAAIINHGDRYWMAGGNEPDPPVADAYASVNDLYLRWGYINVRAWADIDNDRDPDKIMARILWALQSATAAMNKVIERSNYKCPLERVDASYPLVPQTERNICAGVAGEILFKGRQIAATNDSPTIERAVEDFNNWSNDILNGGFIAGVKGKND